jgi:hypothetical protein
MGTVNINRLHSFLLEQCNAAPSLAEAAVDMNLLHMVLVARLAKRGITKPSEREVYQELQELMEQP